MNAPLPLLVTFAVRTESRPFRRRGRRNPGVAILETGMGRANAEKALLAMLETHRPTLVISSGFAGGLKPELGFGDVVFAADDALPIAADLVAAGAVVVRFRPVERVLSTALEKQLLRQMTGADAVEMESQVIRAICRARHIPSATVRVISDTAQEDLPFDWNEFLTPDYRLRTARLTWALMRSPRTLRTLLAFHRRMRRAAERLATTLTRVIEVVPTSSR